MLEANAIQVRIGELCHQFRLPTMGAQTVSRFTAAGHGDALETLLEVLEQEAEDRRQRRIGRLRTASRLPAGKTWETFEHHRVPLAGLCTKASNHKPVTTRLVRRHLWMSPGGFSMSRRDSDSEKVPAALYDRLTDTPTYAARMYKASIRPRFGPCRGD